MMKINERIKHLRKDVLHMTQQEFADRIMVKRNTVATYEMGRSEPSDSAFALICKEFNVNPNWLRHGTGEMLIATDREDQFMMWAWSVLSETDECFKKRFIKMLPHLNESDWEVLEKLSLMLSKEKG